MPNQGRNKQSQNKTTDAKVNPKAPGSIDSKNLGTNLKDAPQGSFNIGRFFVKKMLYDADAACLELKDRPPKDINPDIKIEILVNNTALPNDNYIVILTIKANATSNNKPFFSGIVEQAGIFSAKNFNEEQLNFILKGYCPSLLFPYARENVANMLLRGGFKTLELPPIDFSAVYQRSHLQELEREKATGR